MSGRNQVIPSFILDFLSFYSSEMFVITCHILFHAGHCIFKCLWGGCLHPTQTASRSAADDSVYSVLSTGECRQPLGCERGPPRIHSSTLPPARGRRDWAGKRASVFGMLTKRKAWSPGRKRARGRCLHKGSVIGRILFIAY